MTPVHHTASFFFMTVPEMHPCAAFVQMHLKGSRFLVFFLCITERHLHTAVIGQVRVPPFGCICCFFFFCLTLWKWHQAYVLRRCGNTAGVECRRHEGRGNGGGDAEREMAGGEIGQNERRQDAETQR